MIDGWINKNIFYILFGLLMVGGIFYMIFTMPASDAIHPPGAYSIGSNYTSIDCIQSPDLCRYPLNLTMGGVNASK